MADTEVSFPFVLVAEDNSDDRLLLKYAFRQSRLPNAFHIVEDGREALLWLKLALEDPQSPLLPKPGMLLMDLNGTGENSLTVLEWIRQQPEYLDLPVIILGGEEVEQEVAGGSPLLQGRNYLLKRGDFSKAVRLVADLSLLQLA